MAKLWTIDGGDPPDIARVHWMIRCSELGKYMDAETQERTTGVPVYRTGSLNHSGVFSGRLNLAEDLAFLQRVCLICDTHQIRALLYFDPCLMN